MTYIIKDWDLHYEKADTRKCKKMSWVAIPTDTADKKYRKITKMKDGPELFGMWLAIIEVASKMPIRGVLKDKDGDLSFEDMELIGGFPAKAYEKALNTLSSPEIGWVIYDKCGISEETANSGDYPDNILKLQEVVLTTRQDKTEQDITRQDKTLTNVSVFLDSLKVEYPYLNDPEFRENFINHLKQKKASSGDIAIIARLKKLQAVNLGSANDALLSSIDSGWSGVFPKQDQKKPELKQEPSPYRLIHAK